jgi:arylsulfatase A-like enzyme
MNKLKILWFSFLTSTGMCLLAKAYGQIINERPNIVFLLTDDQRYDALGCMGNDEIQTPNIDKLGAKGVIFTHFYNTTSICMASRAQMMTGMYEFKTGCNFTHGALTSKKFQKSYPLLLKKAGYKIGFTGKFGFAVKEEGAESDTYKTNEDMPMDEFDWWKGWPGQGYYQTIKNEFMVEYADRYPHVSEALGASSVDFIKEFSNQKEPFCLSVSFKAPHNPVSPDKKYEHIYKGKTFRKPPNYGEKGAEHLPKQAKLGRQYQRLGKHWDEERYDYQMARYYQLIYGVDVAVGMIMDELEKQGVADNTLIIYTTDNGYSTGAHGFGGKVLPYEEASRGPLIIYAPGYHSENKQWRNHALTGNIDMAPTILEYAGLSIPDNMDGESLVPLLSKKDAKVKEHQAIIQAWGESPTHSLSIVTDKYKYLYWFYGDGMQPKEELYDLQADRYEMKNLASECSMKYKLQEMQEIYDTYVEKIKEESANKGYEAYAKLYNRAIPWSDKKKIIEIYSGISKREQEKIKKLNNRTKSIKNKNESHEK